MRRKPKLTLDASNMVLLLGPGVVNVASAEQANPESFFVWVHLPEAVRPEPLTLRLAWH